MTWNYRVVKYDGDGHYAIHEAYYDEPSDTEPYAITKDPVAARGDSEREVREDLLRMLMALERPTVSYEGMRGEKEDK